MICEVVRMQISASNLLAAQQTQAAAQQPKPAPSFAAALKADPAVETKAGFEPLPLKKVAAAASPEPAPGEDANPAARPSRPGANLDIRI